MIGVVLRVERRRQRARRAARDQAVACARRHACGLLPKRLAVDGFVCEFNITGALWTSRVTSHVPVRAVENRVWVVAANKVGPLVPARSIEMVAERVGVAVEMLHGAGESQIVAPDGT